MKTFVVCCLFLSLVASNAYFIPKIDIGPSRVAYGWGATALAPSYNAIYDTSLGADQTELIQEALNHVALDGGGTVTILSGTYILQGNIEVYSNTAIVGQGIDITTLQLIANSIDFYYAGFFHAEQTNNVIIANLTIDGNKANQGTTAANTYGKYGIYTEGASETWFDFVRITQMNHYGFDPHGHKDIMLWGQNLTITNCIADNNGWDGFTIDQTMNIVIQNNLAEANARHGFNIVTGSANVLITDNRAINNGYVYVPGGGCGIAVQNDFEFNTHDIYIVSNTITNNNYAGICLNNVTDIYISANNLVDNCICTDILYGGYVFIDNNLCEGQTAVTAVNVSLFQNGGPPTTPGVYYSSLNNVFTPEAACSVIINPVSQLVYTVGYDLTPSNTSFSITSLSAATSVIQLALNAISANGGGTVLINPGTYSISGTISISSGTHLKGSGMDQTFLTLIDDAEPFVLDNAGFLRSRFTNEVTISDMTLNGNLLNQCCTATCQYGRTGIFIEGCTNILIENVQTTNFQLNGIDIHGWENIWGENAVVTNCISNGNSYNGITLNIMDTVNVTGSNVYLNGEDGIVLQDTVNFLGQSNNVVNNGYLYSGCGFDVIDTPDDESGVSNAIYNNYIYGNSKGGICLTNTDANIQQNVLNDSCICLNFVSAWTTTIYADNTCVGFKSVLSSPAFVVPLDNIFVRSECTTISPPNLQCINGYYHNSTTSSGTTPPSSTGTGPASTATQPSSTATTPGSSTGTTQGSSTATNPTSSTGSPSLNSASSNNDSMTSLILLSVLAILAL